MLHNCLLQALNLDYKLFCREALENSGVRPQDIGQLVYISSTDFTTPGLDCVIIDGLDLSRNVNRFPILFQGCGAGLKGLSVAKQFCVDNPGKSSLIVCNELNSLLNITERYGMGHMVKNALFGDGCSAAVISSDYVEKGDGKWVIESSASTLVENTGNIVKLFWNNDGNFDSNLSPELPKVVKSGIFPFVDEFLKNQELDWQDNIAWAVHPGGPAILRAVQSGLKLSDDHMQQSWDVLQNYGNMSAATIWFVLDQTLKKKENTADNVIALAFGPGVYMESIYLKKF